MAYNAEIVRKRYDNFGDKEWKRLEKDAHGVLLYEVHKELLLRHIKKSDNVLEIGAGSGRYTKDIVNICNELTVADISTHQIEFNKQKMKELGKFDDIKAFHVTDMLKMNMFEDNSYDNVVCIGGPLSYLLEKEKEGLQELFRVTKTGGTVILGVMSFLGATAYYLNGILHEKEAYGIKATKWMFDTGIQDGVNYPSLKQHYCHMFRSIELDELLSNFDVQVIEKSSAGLFTIADDCESDRLEKIRQQDKEMWDLIVEKEIEFTKYSGTLDCGMNIIYVIKKL